MPATDAPENTPLAPSVEKAYYRKCIELKRRLNEVEAANDVLKIKRTRLDRAILKMRLERAFLLDQLSKRMDYNVDGSEGSNDEAIATPPPDRPHREKRRRAQPSTPAHANSTQPVPASSSQPPEASVSQQLQSNGGPPRSRAGAESTGDAPSAPHESHSNYPRDMEGVELHNLGERNGQGHQGSPSAGGTVSAAPRSSAYDPGVSEEEDDII